MQDDNRDYHAVLRERNPVAKDNILQSNLRFSIDKHAPGTSFSSKYFTCIGGKTNQFAIFRDFDMFVWDADRFGEFGVPHEVLILTVHRHKKLGMQEVEHQLQVFASTVSGDMHVCVPFVEYLRATLEQMVHDMADGLLVAGDNPRRDDDGIALFHLQKGVRVKCHQRHCRARFALAARA